MVTEQSTIWHRIDKALDEVRPHLLVDGGNIEIVEITQDLDVFVKWIGNCEFCSMSAMTMRAGIEQAIKSKIPEVRSIKATNGLN